MLLALDELVLLCALDHTGGHAEAIRTVDTWFFLAAAPPVAGRRPRWQGVPTDSIWVSPRQALEGGESGRFRCCRFDDTRNLIRLGKQARRQGPRIDDSRGKPVVTVMPS